MKAIFVDYRTDLPVGHANHCKPHKLRHLLTLAHQFGQIRTYKREKATYDPTGVVEAAWERRRKPEDPRFRRVGREQVAARLPNVKGATVCELFDMEGNKRSGYAFCSQSDSFTHKRGRQIAHGRARKALERALRESAPDALCAKGGQS